MNKFTLRYNSSPLASLSNLRAKMRKIAIVSVRLKTDFWPSSRSNYSTFQGPTVKMQAQCYSTPGVVYKYVKLTRTEETRKLLWNAKLCINTCGQSIFQCPSPWWLVLYAMYAVCVCGYCTGLPRNFTAHSCGGPGRPQFLHRAPQTWKNAVFCRNWRLSAR